MSNYARFGRKQRLNDFYTEAEHRPIDLFRIRTRVSQRYCNVCIYYYFSESSRVFDQNETFRRSEGRRAYLIGRVM